MIKQYAKHCEVLVHQLLKLELVRKWESDTLVSEDGNEEADIRRSITLANKAF